ncbi:hypothetical protein AAVH_31111, partial [Aphelenchoides avenae]
EPNALNRRLNAARHCHFRTFHHLRHHLPQPSALTPISFAVDLLSTLAPHSSDQPHLHSSDRQQQEYFGQECSADFWTAEDAFFEEEAQGSFNTLTSSVIIGSGGHEFPLGAGSLCASMYAPRTSSPCRQRIASHADSPQRQRKENVILRSPRRVVPSSGFDPGSHSSGVSVKGMMKQKLLNKICKLLSREHHKSSKHSDANASPPELAIPACERKRSRSSQSSALSNYEPMPTILEETESELDLESLHPTVHAWSNSHFTRHGSAA